MQKEGGGGGGGAAPTGCFKCGRPGHWSRDCPSSAPANPRPNSTSFPSKFQQGTGKTQGVKPDNAPAPSAASKRVRQPRPKLTPELLLSDDGLGYVLRHFPRAFKYHGRGHEASDLGNLIALYAQWHSHLIPYYSFDQFITKVEQIGTTRRVKMCLRELRERVANGGDPTKLHEPPTELVDPDVEPESLHTDTPVMDEDNPPRETADVDDIQEEVFDEIYRKATEESRHPVVEDQLPPSQNTDRLSSENCPLPHPSNEGDNETANFSTNSPKIQITEEQKARMEANRLKALERAAARGRSSQTS